MTDICSICTSSSNYEHDHDVFLIYLKQPVFIFHFIKEVFQKKISFMGTAIKFISEFTFLFISTMNNDGTYRHISKTA